MRVVFMGTPDIAATCLKRLLAEQFVPVGDYTKPDMPKNRGMKLEMSDVKKVALEAGLPVFQPATFKDDAVVEELRALQPDVIAVVAYGKILPQRVLDIPRLGCGNSHASVLPALRGSGPGGEKKEPALCAVQPGEGLWQTGGDLLPDGAEAHRRKGHDRPGVLPQGQHQPGGVQLPAHQCEL